MHTTFSFNRWIVGGDSTHILIFYLGRSQCVYVPLISWIIRWVTWVLMFLCSTPTRSMDYSGGRLHRKTYFIHIYVYIYYGGDFWSKTPSLNRNSQQEVVAQVGYFSVLLGTTYLASYLVVTLYNVYVVVLETTPTYFYNIYI